MNYLFKNNKKKIRFSFSIFLIIMVLIYILFALKRIKYSLSFEINNFKISNEFWIFPIILLIKFFYNKNFKKSKLNIKNNLQLLICLFFIICIILFGGFKVENNKQFLLALMELIIPMLFIFSITIYDIDYFDIILKLIVFFNLIYSILAIIAVSRFGYLMEILGNQSNLQYYSQYRASLMIGSSITVSYYFNITLPFCFYAYIAHKEKLWKLLDIITIILNIIATFLLQSRLASLISIIIVLYYMILVNSNNFSFFKKIFILIFGIVLCINIFNKYDLSRLYLGFNDYSTILRIYSMKLGLYFFEKNPLLGSGLGKYYLRFYSNSELDINGNFGLIDPHNTYVFILSEMGILGLLAFIIYFIIIINNFKYIKNNSLKKSAYIFLIAYFVGALGGSQIVNEISFATLFWIYISIFRAISLRDYFAINLSEQI